MEKTIKLPDEIRNSFKEATEEQILSFRLTGKRLVVIKLGETLYTFPVKKSEEARIIKEVFGTHKCSKCSNFFNGTLCPKVADLSAESCRRFAGSEMEAVIESKRIEKYSIIEKGVEYVNSLKEYFIVEECSNFKENSDKKEREALRRQITEEFLEDRSRSVFSDTKRECWGSIYKSQY